MYMNHDNGVWVNLYYFLIKDLINRPFFQLPLNSHKTKQFQSIKPQYSSKEPRAWTNKLPQEIQMQAQFPQWTNVDSSPSNHMEKYIPCITGKNKYWSKILQNLVSKGNQKAKRLPEKYSSQQHDKWIKLSKSLGQYICQWLEDIQKGEGKILFFSDLFTRIPWPVLAAYFPFWQWQPCTHFAHWKL